MDTRTIEKIIAMLDMRIQKMNEEFETTNLHGYDLDFLQGMKIEAMDFREHLRKLTVIHTELNLENDYNQDMYDIMNEINDQDRLQADEESRLGQED